MKGAGDFVSRADIAAEQILKDELMGARPTYGWLAEEGGAEDGEDPTRRWIVDPLDGTTNFLHGLPHWAISIALEHKGKVVAGVIYDAAKDEMFFAEKGEGAWLNESRLRVSGRRSDHRPGSGRFRRAAHRWRRYSGQRRRDLRQRGDFRQVLQGDPRRVIRTCAAGAQGAFAFGPRRPRGTLSPGPPGIFTSRRRVIGRTGD